MPSPSPRIFRSRAPRARLHLRSFSVRGVPSPMSIGGCLANLCPSFRKSVGKRPKDSRLRAEGAEIVAHVHKQRCVRPKDSHPRAERPGSKRRVHASWRRVRSNARIFRECLPGGGGSSGSPPSSLPAFPGRGVMETRTNAESHKRTLHETSRGGARTASSVVEAVIEVSHRISADSRASAPRPCFPRGGFIVGGSAAHGSPRLPGAERL